VSIDPISLGMLPVSSVGATSGLAPLESAALGSGATRGAAGVSTGISTGISTGTDFAAMLSRGIERVQELQATSDTLAVQAATGDLDDVHDYMIASTEASLATELTVAVRNKAVDAFTEIMRMQI
jgi:flagellar hook-basal body complex protein FliE